MNMAQMEKRTISLGPAKKKRKKDTPEMFAVLFYGKNEDGFPEDYPKKVFKLKEGVLPYPGCMEMTREELVSLLATYSDFQEGFLYKRSLQKLRERKLQELKNYVDEMVKEFLADKYPESIEQSFPTKIIEAEEYLSLERAKEDCYILYEEAKELFKTEKPTNAQMVQLCEKITYKANGDGFQIGYKQFIGRISGRYERIYDQIKAMETMEELKEFDIKEQFSNLDFLNPK
jgi:hypothetical protein